jgi:hypothetical protein
MREENAILDYSDDALVNEPAKPHRNIDDGKADVGEADALPHDALYVDINESTENQRDETPLNEADDGSEIGEIDDSIKGDGKGSPPDVNDPEDDSEAELERKLDNLYVGHDKKDRKQPHIDSKPKIGAAKAKRQKRAEKMAALEAEGKAPSKSSKSRRPLDPSAAMQKARGETATSGRKQGKKK